MRTIVCGQCNNDSAVTYNMALKGVMCLDAVGMALGWRMFDHAAHLGGALFGLIYASYGPKYIWGNTQHIKKKWHDIRNGINEKSEDKKRKED
ncbi:Presenilins-associated rhomboid-like protein-like [Homarus americanus]|uniref:Presenilins-associated rhomboid-like protein-like n=1 Tax=Homarus americanus TaxID=6706 RepID=A0A8J5MT99_HOMAM|nr:Presenilins-associated rhomboid-like protein-like [Homarus americanus]